MLRTISTKFQGLPAFSSRSAQCRSFQMMRPDQDKGHHRALLTCCPRASTEVQCRRFNALAPLKAACYGSFPVRAHCMLSYHVHLTDVGSIRRVRLSWNKKKKRCQFSLTDAKCPIAKQIVQMLMPVQLCQHPVGLYPAAGGGLFEWLLSPIHHKRQLVFSHIVSIRALDIFFAG